MGYRNRVRVDGRERESERKRTAVARPSLKNINVSLLLLRTHTHTRTSTSAHTPTLSKHTPKLFKALVSAAGETKVQPSSERQKLTIDGAINRWLWCGDGQTLVQLSLLLRWLTSSGQLLFGMTCTQESLSTFSNSFSPSTPGHTLSHTHLSLINLLSRSQHLSLNLNEMACSFRSQLRKMT